MGQTFSTLKPPNARQRNKTRMKSAIREMKGRLAQLKLHILDCKPSQA